jgi:hypothetical protein
MNRIIGLDFLGFVSGDTPEAKARVIVATPDTVADFYSADSKTAKHSPGASGQASSPMIPQRPNSWIWSGISTWKERNHSLTPLEYESNILGNIIRSPTPLMILRFMRSRKTIWGNSFVDRFIRRARGIICNTQYLKSGASTGARIHPSHWNVGADNGMLFSWRAPSMGGYG